MTENNHIEQHTQQQKETLANTIGSKKGISLAVGLKELGRAMGVDSKKPEKKHHNPYQISEPMEQFDRKRAKKRPPMAA